MQPQRAFARFALLVVLAWCAAPTATARQPNVVVLLADDQGWGDLSLHGNTDLATPHLDGLARDGAQFERFYVCPVCSPTRAEFFTGRYHPRGGVAGVTRGRERLDLDEVTIADCFRAAGYATAAFGKWHNGMQYPYHPLGRGFEEYYGFCSGHWGHYFSPMLEHNGQITRGDGYVVDDFTSRALAFIEEHRDQPFLVYLPYNTPHSPMQVPDRWWENFADKQLEMHAHDQSRQKLAHTRAALAMCENIDWNVGRVLEKLDELQLADDTIVLYFSDNGPNGHRWNDGMRGIKGSTDEGGVRSPLLVRYPPMIKPGTVVTLIAGAIDLLPTLCDLAGVERVGDKPLDGQSLVPLLTGTAGDWPARMLFSHWGGRVSVRTDRHRLDHEGRLYEMHADPGQDQDIAAEQPEVATRLQTAVADWKRDVLAELDGDDRPFPVGHADFALTQLPARDAELAGEVQRSNRHANCTFLTNWRSVDDRIVWNCEVLTTGDYEVTLYYTCAEADVGSKIEVSFGDKRLTAEVTETHDPPLVGAAEDRDPRIEGYVKDFRPLKIGSIRLDRGRGKLTIRALKIPGSHVMDLRLLMLGRVRE